jgi:hypothetical protein
LLAKSWDDLIQRQEDRGRSKRVHHYPDFRGRETEFQRDVLGERHWKFQRTVTEQLFSHGKCSVRTSHGVGKTRVAASIVLTFLMTREDSIVISTAPTDHQVRNLLWAEIGRMHARAKEELPGSPDQKQLRLGPRWYALGLSTNKPARFQGFHGSVDTPDDPDQDIEEAPEFNFDDATAEGDREAAIAALQRAATEGSGGILLVFDEAAGIDQTIFDAARGALTSPGSYVLMIGNPDLDLATEHAFVKSHQPGSDFVTIRCSAEPGPEDALTPDFSFDRPPNWLVSRAWVKESKRDYGIGTALCYSKIWGQFAGGDATARVMPNELLLVASRNYVAEDLGAHIGLDVSDEGGDETVACLTVDGTVRSIDGWRPRIGDKSPLMSIATRLMALRDHWAALLVEEGFAPTVDEAIPWEHVHVDAIGVGKGVTERLAQRGIFVDKVDFGSKPKKDWRALTGKVAFANRRAELHWVLRRAAEEGLFSINREAFPDAWRQAQWAIYEYRHQGGTVVILIMPKKDIRKSYKRSPDHWDAVLLSYSRTGSRRLRIR